MYHIFLMILCVTGLCMHPFFYSILVRYKCKYSSLLATELLSRLQSKIKLNQNQIEQLENISIHRRHETPSSQRRLLILVIIFS